MDLKFDRIRASLRDGGMAYLYATFIAGYFLMPMVSGHRRLYYILVLPAVLLLWRELAELYRGNRLWILLLVFAAYNVCSILWTSEPDPSGALWSLWFTIALLSFCAITGFLFVEAPQLMDQLLRYSLWLAAAAGLVSTVAWYAHEPFPSSRLEPMGVMHLINNAACVYGFFSLLALHYYLKTTLWKQKLVYLVLMILLLGVVLFTQTRTAVAAVCVGSLVFLGYRALGLLVAVIALNWALLMSNTQLWTDRVLTFSFRPGIWQQTLSDMHGHWLLGYGSLVNQEISAYGQVFNHAHNSYLATLRDGGLLGLGILAAVLAQAGFWALQYWRERGEPTYLALLLYGMTCVALDFDRLLVHPNEMWLFFWTPIAVIMALYPATRNDSGSTALRSAH